jgi:hypothetical protein
MTQRGHYGTKGANQSRRLLYLPARMLTVLGFLFRVLARLRNLASESHKRGIAFKEPYLIILAAERLNPLPRLDRRVLCQAIVLVVTEV